MLFLPGTHFYFQAYCGIQIRDEQAFKCSILKTAAREWEMLVKMEAWAQEPAILCQ